MVIASKQVNNYDISAQGRSSWTQDPTQPGYGNFCYGHRQVTSIDNAPPGTNALGEKTEQINYHFQLTDVQGWAKSQEMQTAFPQLNNAAAGSQPAQVILAMIGNNWQVSQ